MGQAFSSCVPCVGYAHDDDAAPSVNEARMENEYLKEPQREPGQTELSVIGWTEKIRTNEDKIQLAVDPKFTKEKISQDRAEILENLRIQPFC